MKVLSIGNSFSEDAQAYLKGVCEAAGVEMLCANLYIGGCSLVHHYNCMKDGVKEHTLIVNGTDNEGRVSVEEGLKFADWDVITFQESSGRSGEICHFQPYLSELIAEAKKICPKAKIALHQTWGYGKKLENAMKHIGFRNTLEMFDGVDKVYRELYKSSDVDILIPSGRVLRRLFVEGYNIHFDGQHASQGVGRYALALTWMRILFGIKASGNSFSDFDVFVSREEKDATWAAVDALELSEFIKA